MKVAANPLQSLKWQLFAHGHADSTRALKRMINPREAHDWRPVADELAASWQRSDGVPNGSAVESQPQAESSPPTSGLPVNPWVKPWVVNRWQQLDRAGFLQWFVPQDIGGSLEIHTEADRLELGMILASGCLTTAFLLSQRNASVLRLAASPYGQTKTKWLKRSTQGATFSTVGISHLTTSRQFATQPVVSATICDDGGYLLNGVIPWVSSAQRASSILTGATIIPSLADADQMLVMIDPEQPGVDVLPPLPLLGLNETSTGSVELRNVKIRVDDIVAGPQPQVLKGSSLPSSQNKNTPATGSLSTTSLALGATLGTIKRLSLEVVQRPELQPIYEALLAEATDFRSQLFACAHGTLTTSPEILRQQANSLVVRAAQVYLSACKGAGFMQGHPASRAICEAMFFTVWSCPQSVVMASLKQLTCTSSDNWN